MIHIGLYNRLIAARDTPHGMVLQDEEGDDVLLPNKYVPKGLAPGDPIDVFVYTDSNDWPIATTLRPKAIVGEFAFMQAKEITPIGAFMDWGLEKDLFVPFSEQSLKMTTGNWYFVYLYLDEQTDRVAASSKLNKYLDKSEPELKIGEEVQLLIGPQTPLGFNAFINNRYKGLLYKSEFFQPLRPGMRVKGYVKLIRPDGKVDLSLQPQGYQQAVPTQAEQILEALKKNKGFLPLTDKSDPDEVASLLKMSKKAFKKAVGALYKQRLIRLEEAGIYLEEGDSGQ
ncbi:MAG: GntR family transcriptional regulator [Phaeodactylibacter sp.]|nr:GntR family transcriptional regulator [Phaeodactylibacter sp.]MCB9300342.1 GntR family transcriptional regulator [Lewinellaceae bacterium]